MWIMSKQGTFSIVASKTENDRFLVRTRFVKDIANLINILERDGFSDFESKITPNADYPYRLVITGRMLDVLMSEFVDTLNYSNFKDHIKHDCPDQKHKVGMYTEIWSMVLDHAVSEDELPGCYGSWQQHYNPGSAFQGSVFNRGSNGPINLLLPPERYLAEEYPEYPESPNGSYYGQEKFEDDLRGALETAFPDEDELDEHQQELDEKTPEEIAEELRHFLNNRNGV